MKIDPVVYVNGEWIQQSRAKISLLDAGFLYGDGLFETIRFQHRKLFRPEQHISRLRDGLSVLNLKLDIPDGTIIQLLTRTISENTMDHGLLRLIITRGVVLDKPWDVSSDPSVYILPRPLSPTPIEPVKIVWLQESQFPLIRFQPAIKSVNYLGNMLAKREAENDGAFEPVFVDNDGFITEGAIRNIFFIRDNTVITPGLDRGVLPGVMRDTVIEIARDIRIKVFEENIAWSDVNQMDEAFITSSGIGILPCYWEGWSSKFKITKILKNKIDIIIENTFK